VLESMLATRIQQLSDRTPNLSFLDANCRKLKQFLADLKYTYFNHNMRKFKKYVPELYDNAVFCLKIALATCFTFDKLAIFNPEQFDLVLADIQLFLYQNLLEYGTPIGINTAQCFQEFLTQTLLDSIHKTGTGRVKKTSLERISEIFANKRAEDQKHAPVIRIPLTPETTRERADFIANRIKLIQFRSIVSAWSMLFTDLENLQKPDATFRSDLSFLSGVSIPSTFTKWCLRVELDKMKLYINSVSM